MSCVPKVRGQIHKVATNMHALVDNSVHVKVGTVAAGKPGTTGLGSLEHGAADTGGKCRGRGFMV